MFHNIQFIYFDLDDTLMDFTNASKNAFIHLLNHYQLPLDHSCFDIYQSGNHQTWIEFEQNLISSHELRSLRFKRFFLAMNWSDRVDPFEMNQTYIHYLIKETTLISGALSLLLFFKNKIPMGILTNGLKEAQRPRLFKADLVHFFDEIIVSDEIGISKPNPEIFKLAKEKTGNLPSENILLIGDNPKTDIEAAQKFGFKTVWFNPENKKLPENIKSELIIENLEQLIPFFHSHPNINI